ncbi:MAG: hypothetical protein JWM12_2521, partial [Ilumatobacteraceae bacterium]|nr:hypothetical protein [Ilumatobacteraceae bacterium]
MVEGAARRGPAQDGVIRQSRSRVHDEAELRLGP